LFVATFMGAVLLLQSPLDLLSTKQEPCQFGKTLQMPGFATKIATAPNHCRSDIVQMRNGAVGLPNFTTRGFCKADTHPRGQPQRLN